MSDRTNTPMVLKKLPPDLALKDILDPGLVQLLIKANSALAELNGTCRAISNPALLLTIPILQESVASSEIEGIHTTVETALEDQVKLEGDRNPASKEALRYKEAVNEGFADLTKFSISTRTILKIHGTLMPANGGRFRQQQNQIAKGTKIIYTPPEAKQIDELMSDWEKYVHSEHNNFDVLIRVAVAHYQFEAIHPFIDGNGRTGRILMVLQLVLEKKLDLPILYVSGFLNKHRDKYYRLLGEVTESANWIEFIRFMLSAIHEQASITQNVIFKILEERSAMKTRLSENFPAIYSPDLLDHLFSYPITFPTFMAEKLNITYQTASKHLGILEQANVLRKRKDGRHTLYYNFHLLSCLKT